MSEARQRLVRSVFHPSDFSEGSHGAFEHALALALLRETEFTILHVGDGSPEWTSFPGVRRTLEAWGILDAGSPRSAVPELLKVNVQKVSLKGRRPLETILAYLEDNPTDLIVLATRGAEGLPRWIHPSVAEPLARRSRTMTLFIPQGCRGIVDRETGSLSIRRILLPLEHTPDPAAAIEVAGRAATLDGGPAEITLFHVGESRMPTLDLPDVPGVRWNPAQVSGDVVSRILEAASRERSDLIVMTTAGHQGILDALRGSTTEQVLRAASCPLLAIPHTF